MDGMIEKVFNSKFVKDYGVNEYDYEAPAELTVKITLAEYRDLIEKAATSAERVKKANENKYERDSRNEALEKENAELKSELLALRKRIDNINNNDANDDF